MNVATRGSRNPDLRVASRSTRRLVALCAVLFSTAAYAREEGASASSLGVSDAVRSSAVGPAGLTFNPAAMHQLMQYAIETGYEYSQPIDGHTFSVAVVDSATNAAIAMGVGYSYIYGHEVGSDVERTGHNLRFGAASGWRGENWSVHAGASGRYLSLSVGSDGAAEGITMDAGLLVVVGGMFRFAVVGHHLVDTGLKETPRQLGFGTSIYVNSFIASFDAVLDFETQDETKAQYRVGLEYAVMDRLPIRLGYESDRLVGSHAISAGLGYVTRVIGIDFGFRQNLVDTSDNVFSLNIRGFIP
jgi:hypothetical protein